MAKLKKTLQNVQMPAVPSTKISIVKKRNRRKKKTNIQLLNNMDKNNLKKLSASNEIVKNIFTNTQNNKRKKLHSSKNKFDAKNFSSTKYPKNNENNLKKLNISNTIGKDTNMQSNKRKKSHDFKNKLNANYTENSDFLTKYPKDNKNIKKLSASNEIAKDVFTNMQKSKKKKLRDSKNELDAIKYTENSDGLTKYPKDKKKYNLKKLSVSNRIAKDMFANMQNNKRKKRDSKNKLDAKYTENSDASTKYSNDDKKKILKVSQKIQNNSNIKIKYEKNKKRKQDMNLNRTNKDTVRDNYEDVEIDEDSSEDNGSKNIKKKEEKVKKLQMEIKNLKFMMRKLIEGNNEENMKQISTKVETQQIQSDILKLDKHKINIKYLKKMLENKSQVTKVAQSTLRDKKPTLRDRMQMQLKASRFRFINETLYNNDSLQSKHYFQKDPDSFMAYHAGYKQQIEQWPINPLDVIISSIKKLPTDNVIADFGCGEARLAASVPHTVHSFDFIALNDEVKACDMAHTPLLMNSIHVVVFCLSLMGSNLNDYIIEANRVLKNNGILKIAEVESRFEDVKDFIRLLRHYGFKNTWKDLSHNLFYFMDFKKNEDISMKRKNLPAITLKSCVYKKR
ncbi:Ribosomal RNA-processing protein 8 [Atta colombica]|uniref:Ribosomal RNA-processing protein 8 n=1 Tax=Atta colombica TaxID=520822 RepID=A0A195BWV9_9HYME|nr:PREDICTED: ribosomal RNA-processing protein 8-like [Atta colombica]KYM92446.1 Ribosomal RNA-processing protein 8 [Atta colombica]